MTCAAIVAAATFAAGCGASDQDAVRGVVRDYLEASVSGQGAKACRLLTTKALRQIATATGRPCQAAIAAAAESIGADVRAEAANIPIKIMVRGSTATARVGSGETYGGTVSDAIVLRRIDGSWFIDSTPAGAIANGVRFYRVPSESMLPTLRVGERVAVTTRFGALGVGDLIVFHPPAGATVGGGENCGAPPPPGAACDQPTAQESSVTFIKRIVGLPGDRISIVNGHVIRNGQHESDSYIRPCDASGACTFPRPIVIPRGMYFTLGDNRGASDDSRFWGPVPRAWIVGKVLR